MGLINVRGDDNDACLGRSDLDVFQPPVEFALLVAVPRIPHQQEQGTVAEEKLVGSVVKILPGKVPAIQTHRHVRLGRMRQI